MAHDSVTLSTASICLDMAQHSVIGWAPAGRKAVVRASAWLAEV